MTWMFRVDPCKFHKHKYIYRLYVSISVQQYICVCIFLYVYINICIFLNVYFYIYVFTYIYIHIEILCVSLDCWSPSPLFWDSGRLTTHFGISAWQKNKSNIFFGTGHDMYPSLKTNMTGWKIHYLKMYFQLNMVDFTASYVSFRGCKLDGVNCYRWWKYSLNATVFVAGNYRSHSWRSKT